MKEAGEKKKNGLQNRLLYRVSNASNNYSTVLLTSRKTDEQNSSNGTLRKNYNN